MTRCVGYICIETDWDDDENVCIQTNLDDGEVDETDTIELSCYILPYNHFNDDDDYYCNYDGYYYDDDGVEVDDVDYDYCVL